MAKNICSVCGEKFEDEYFDKEQNKCILHCEKDNWYDDSGKLKDKYINSNGSFFEYLGKLLEHNLKIENDRIENIKKDKDFYIQDSFDFLCDKYIFPEIDFGYYNDFRKVPLYFKNCNFVGETKFSGHWNKNVIFYDNCNIMTLNFSNSEFKNKVKIQFCNIDDANFYNTKFKDLSDFYQTKFQKVNFERTDFEKTSVFIECEFNCDVDFKYTNFLGKSIFDNTVIKGKLDLRNTIFNEYVNLLDITSIQIPNRETARKIKDSFEKQSNFIEANKYYALEMKEREKELDKTKKKNFFEWFVFKIHGIASNHSQDWLLALFWILTIGTIGGFINFYSIEEHLGFWSIFGTLFFSIIIFFCNSLNKWWKLGLFFILYLYKTEDINFHFVIKVINPFQKVSDIGILDFVFKVIIAYLIYQFIVSIRQNTRRK